MESYEWYQQMIKPFWAPPAWLFGPVWTALYILIAISFGYVVYLYLKKKIPFSILLPFVLNLVFNFSFTPIQFWLKNNFLATLDILLVLTTLVWALVLIRPHARWVAYINIPYFFWVCFATILQISVTLMN